MRMRADNPGGRRGPWRRHVVLHCRDYERWWDAMAQNSSARRALHEAMAEHGYDEETIERMDAVFKAVLEG